MDIGNSSLREPTFLVIIGHALYSPWLDILLEGQLKTWVDAGADNILHSHGKAVGRYLHCADQKYWQLKWSKKWGRFVFILERVLLPPLNRVKASVSISQSGFGFKSLAVKMPDLNLMMNRKSLAVMDFAARADYDFIVFTTSSSYINLKNLKQVLCALPREGVVAGRILQQHSLRFPSGSFRVFTPDVLRLAIGSRNSYKYWLPEDLALGKLLEEFNLEYIELRSEDVPTIEALQDLDSESIRQTIHFRVKNEVDGIRTDIQTMKALHKLVEGRA